MELNWIEIRWFYMADEVFQKLEDGYYVKRIYYNPLELITLCSVSLTKIVVKNSKDNFSIIKYCYNTDLQQIELKINNRFLFKGKVLNKYIDIFVNPEKIVFLYNLLFNKLEYFYNLGIHYKFEEYYKELYNYNNKYITNNLNGDCDV